MFLFIYDLFNFLFCKISTFTPFFFLWILDVEQTHPQFPQYRLEPHWYDRFSQGWNRTKLQSKQRRPGRKGIGKNPQGLRFSKMFFGELCITSVRISLHILFVIYQCPFWHCYRDSAKEFGSNWPVNLCDESSYSHEQKHWTTSHLIPMLQQSLEALSDASWRTTSENFSQSFFSCHYHLV